MKRDEFGKKMHVGALVAAAEAARRLAGDDSARRALRQTYGRGRELWERLEREGGAADALGRVARDARLQREVGAFVRAAAKSVDRAVAVERRRRRRRRFAWLAAMGGVTAAIAGLRRIGASPDGGSPSPAGREAPSAQPATSGA